MPAYKEIGFEQFYAHLGRPQATPVEIDAWNTIKKDASYEGDIKVGLFGYDISAIAQVCHLINNEDVGYNKEYYGYCPLIESRGLDGLAFGVYWNHPDKDLGWYWCAGFRNDEPGNRNGNTMACADENNDMETYYFYDNY